MTNEQAMHEEEILEVADSQQEEENVFEVLFESRDPKVTFGAANQLANTAQLTATATKVANEILEVLRKRGNEMAAQIEASQESHDAMDDLINDIYPLHELNLSFLERINDEEIEKMLRSQQSKRSRAKSKVMNLENYKTMMTGAIAENLLRMASGKAKNTGSGVVMQDIGFSAEDLEKLAEFPEDLKKAIRNVQSKKSIMKHKSDFDPTSPRWLQLIAAEQQLKEIRDTGNAALSEEARNALAAQKHVEEVLSNVDTETMSAEEAKAMLDSLKEMLASK